MTTLGEEAEVKGHNQWTGLERGPQSLILPAFPQDTSVRKGWKAGKGLIALDLASLHAPHTPRATSIPSVLCPPGQPETPRYCGCQWRLSQLFSPSTLRAWCGWYRSVGLLSLLQTPHPSQAPVDWDPLDTHAVLMGPEQPDLPQPPLTLPISCLVPSAQASATSLRVSPWHLSDPAHPLVLPAWALVPPYLFLPVHGPPPHVMFGLHFSHHPATLTPCSLAPPLLWLCSADHHGEAAAGHLPGTSQLPGFDQ